MSALLEPALHNLANDGSLPEHCPVVGVARGPIETALANDLRHLGPRPPRPIASRMLATDPDVTMIRPVRPRTPQGCEACLRIGSPWVHLRLCLTCGYVGCCDSSPYRHARRHAHAVGHPIVQSFEPGEDWRWCYVHEQFV